VIEFLEGTKSTWLGYVHYIGPLVRTKETSFVGL